MKRISLPTLKIILKYSAFLFIGIIVISEFFLRIFFNEQLKTHKYPLIYKTDSIIGYSHIPNIDGHISLPSINFKFHLNNHGFMGDDFQNNKEEGEIRIAVVGNSLTEGIWINTTENYVVQLQRKFHKDGYSNVKVINCSYGGINKDLRNYLHIKHFVSTYNPDIVLFNVGIPFENDDEVREVYKNYMIRYAQNSLTLRQHAIDNVENLQNHKLFIAFYNISFIYRAYCRKYAEKHYGERTKTINTYRNNSSDTYINTFRYSLNTSIKILSELNIQLKNKNETLIVIPFGIDPIISKSLNEENIPFIRFIPILSEKMHFKHDGHPNALGHKEIADQLYPLLKNKLIELKYITL